MSMPWDRFTPDEEEELPYVPPPPVEEVVDPEPEPLPVEEAPDPTQEYVPPPPKPIPVTPADSADVQALAKDLLAEAMGYAKAVIGEISKGKTVDVLNPTVTAVTAKGQELVVADAKSRSWRTLLQGLAIDLIFAVIVLLGTLTQSDVFDKATWTIFFVLLGKTLIQTSAAFFMRLKIVPTVKMPDGEKMALMPVPRPLLSREEK